MGALVLPLNGVIDCLIYSRRNSGWCRRGFR
jgi:hypothetical protein